MRGRSIIGPLRFSGPSRSCGKIDNVFPKWTEVLGRRPPRTTSLCRSDAERGDRNPQDPLPHAGQARRREGIGYWGRAGSSAMRVLRPLRVSSPQSLRAGVPSVPAADRKTEGAIHSGQPAVSKLLQHRPLVCRHPGFHMGNGAPKATDTSRRQRMHVEESATRQTAKNELLGDILFANTVATEAPHAWIWLPSLEHQKERQTLLLLSIAPSTSATVHRPSSLCLVRNYHHE